MQTSTDDLSMPRSDESLSRRDAMTPTAATGVAIAAGGPEAAGTLTERAVDITTADGSCDAVLVHAGTRPSPAVIWYPDGFGLRPTHVDMAKRLAGHGYAVLAINPFYRARRAPVHPPG